MNKGIILQSVIVVLIVVVSTIIVALAITSLLEENAERQKFNKAKALMLNLDNIIRELLLESSGSKRDIRLDVDYGTFIVSGKENRIKSILELKSAIIEPGITIREGNLEIISGGGVSAYERDIDNDGTADLVLENEAILFAVKKMGSSANNVSINVRNIVTRIDNKLSFVSVNATAGFSIEDIDSSSGSGYTELTRQGSNLPSAAIRLYLRSDSGFVYEAIFTLSSRKDFIDMRVNLLA